jgi:hypothetical protein
MWFVAPESVHDPPRRATASLVPELDKQPIFLKMYRLWRGARSSGVEDGRRDEQSRLPVILNLGRTGLCILLLFSAFTGPMPLFPTVATFVAGDIL